MHPARKYALGNPRCATHASQLVTGAMADTNRQAKGQTRRYQRDAGYPVESFRGGGFFAAVRSEAVAGHATGGEPGHATVAASSIADAADTE